MDKYLERPSAAAQRAPGLSTFDPSGGETRIYLDYAATTPVDAEIVAAMLPYWTAGWGNPSSLYAAGRAARAAIDEARATVAHVLGCAPNEIIFTSGGTEGDKLALKGGGEAGRAARGGTHPITTADQHPPDPPA